MAAPDVGVRATRDANPVFSERSERISKLKRASTVARKGRKWSEEPEHP